MHRYRIAELDMMAACGGCGGRATIVSDRITSYLSGRLWENLN